MKRTYYQVGETVGWRDGGCFEGTYNGLADFWSRERAEEYAAMMRETYPRRYYSISMIETDPFTGEILRASHASGMR